MPSPRVAHCVFCDDIRFEMGNKISLMGIYTGVLNVDQSFPLALPKFGVVVWVISDFDDFPANMITTIVLPGGHELVRLESPTSMAPVPPELQEGAQKAILSQAIPLSPLPLLQEGMMEVWVETEKEKLRAGRLWLRSSAAATTRDEINQSPTVSPLPS